MSDSPTILLAGGGTGGHLYPGIGVAQALQSRIPGAKCVFLTTNKEIDKVILEPTGYPFVPQPIVPPHRNIPGLLRFWKAWRETKDLVRDQLREHKPDAVIGLGGYAAGVAVKIAALRGIPTAILNPDVIPGKANQYLMRYSKAVCCHFERTADHVAAEHRAKLKFTGCPIRTDLLPSPDRKEAANRLGLDPKLKTMVVTGASLGAQTVNEAVLTMLAGLTLNGWQILHLSGRDHAAAVRAGYRDLNTTAVIIDFTPAMADVWAVTDLAISRSGASSCAELCALGIPSILMPYPFHRDMHQRLNGQVLVEAGAALMIDDEKDRRKNAAKLKPAVESLLYDGPRRAAMAAAARSIGKPCASDAVAQVVIELFSKPS